MQSLRYALREMQGSIVSDFELIESINQAASLLYSQMSERFVSFGMKKAILTVGNSGSCTLPADYVRIHQVGMGGNRIAIPTSYQPTEDGIYRIIGNMFYAVPGTYSLEYYYIPLRVNNISDDLDVMPSMEVYISQIALALYGNNLEKALQVALNCSQSLAARETSHFANVGPTQVLGGRI